MKHFNKLKQLFLALLVLAGALPALGQPLSGTYTVGGTSPNYATLTAAVADLNSKGVSAPVTFNLRNGTYNEKVTINPITGASATNRVTFKSETNNAANVTVSGSSSTYADIGIFLLKGANYVTIKHLTLEVTSSSYGGGVHLQGAASYDSVLNCSINMPGPNNSSSMCAGIYSYYDGGGYPSGGNNVIMNNTITNGGVGIYFYASGSSAILNNNLIQNNTVTNFGYMGLYCSATGGFKVRNNTFTTSTTYTSAYGVYFYYMFNGCEFSGNTVTLSNNFYSGFYSYMMQGSTNPATWPKVENNTFNFTATTTNPYAALYHYYSDYAQYKNNTITINAPSISYTMLLAYCNGMTFEGNTMNATSTSGTLQNYNQYSSDFNFRKNTINMTAPGSGTVYGIYSLNSGNTGGDYSGNKINVSSVSGTVYGMYQSVPGQKIMNNVINSVTTTGTNYTFYASNPTNTTVANNTFHSRSAASTNYAAFFNSSSGNTKIYNNVFSKTATTGYPLYLSSGANIISDYNNIYTPGGNLAYVGGAYTTLQALRTATGKDLNSISYDPGYTSATNLAPDPANASSWSLNGRGIQIAGNSTDINGAARSTTLIGGVPDLGAYEFTPTATPPAATATPAVPTAGTTQIFTFGQDTVASLVWPAASTVPASITVRQYTGTNPPTINTISTNKMFFYTDVSVPAGTFAHTSNIYYKDPWMGSIGGENALRLAKKDGANPWAAYSAPASTVDINRNIISTTGQTVFGLHTGIDAGDNASAAEIASPAKPFCAGTQVVSAKVKNTGNNTLNSVQINWSVDGITQTPVNYTTPINTLGSGLGNEATVSLGNVTFANTARVIKIWTSLPNGVADLYNTDDTVQATLRSSLSGIYTVGGTTPDYSSITAAITDLNAYGVCGPVTFNIRNGSYTAAQYTLKPVLGASAINRITFQSESGVAANVTVSYNVTSTGSNYVFLLDSASYFTFRNLSVNSTNASNGYSFEFRNTASYDSIVGCVMSQTATTSSTSGAIYAYQTFKGTDVVVAGNTISNGYYGLYLYGTSSIRSTNFVLDGNTFSNQYQYPIYSYYTNELKILNNNIGTPGGSSSWYGLAIYYGDNGLKVIGNNITASGSKSSLYGGQIQYSNNDPSNPGVIRGNTWTLTNTNTTGQVYPLYMYELVNDSVTYNTWNTSSNYYTYDYNYYPTNLYYANNNVNFNSVTYNYGYWYWSGKSNNVVENNTFNFQSNASLYWYQYYWQNSQFRNNTVNLNGGTSVTAMYLYYHSGCIHENNTINANGASTVYGAYLAGSGTSYGNNKFLRNKVKAVSTSTAYGIYGASPYDFTIANNVVSAQSTGNTAAYFSAPNQVRLYNNTLINKTASGTVLNAVNTGTSFIDVKNNVIYNSGNGAGINYSSFTPANLSSDYNNVFVGSTTNKFNTSANLQAWRTASGQDLNSLMYDPGFTNPGANNYSPDPANAASWSLNGRGVHLNGINTDINNNARVTTKAAGVPDIGAYEFTPSVTPPLATANPATATAGAPQYFTFGQDTVCVIDWAASATIPSTVDVRQYTGTVPPSFIPGGFPYFYVDIATSAGAAHGTRTYYKDPWTGTLIGESGFRLVKKDGTNPWTVFSAPASSTNPTWNVNTTTGLADFGLHSLSDVANNAATVALVSPNGYFCAPSTLPIQVKIQNNGNNILNSVQVGWTANGVPQTGITYSTPINIQGNSAGNQATVSLGNYTFPNSSPVNFVFYTYNPNGQNDPAKVDDTLKITIKPGLQGVYTIGGATPDYATIPDAVADINTFGICGPVVFNIRDGAYTAGGTIKSPLQGSSVTNRVTFQSESGNASAVVITATPNVFDFTNVSNLTFRNLKMVNTSTSTGNVLVMNGTASNDTIIGCIFEGPSTTSSSNLLSIINGTSFSGNNTVIKKNSFLNGAGAMYISSGTNLIVDSNNMTGSCYWNVYITNASGLKFRGNQITNTYATSPYGIYLSSITPAGTSAPEFIGNTINFVGYNAPAYLYGFSGSSQTVRAKIADNTLIANSTANYLYSYFGYYSNYADVYNNDMTLNLAAANYVYNQMGYGCQYSSFYKNKTNITTAGYAYAFYPYNSSYCKFYNNTANASAGTGSASYGAYIAYTTSDTFINNTINLNSGASSSIGVYLYWSGYSGNVVYNNVFSNKTGGPVYNATLGGTNTMDYNNVYTTSTTSFATGVTAANLQAWRTASGYDKNSLSYDPGFISTTDLHPDPANPASWSLNGRGVHIAGNNVDFDGNPRVTTLAAGVPDIGAYEFTPTSIPPLATAIPATPTAGVPQTFLFGQDTVARIIWAPNSVVPNTIDVRQYTGTVAPTFPAPGYLYFYADINTANITYNFTADIYYKDPWRGTTGTEGNLRMIRKNGIWDAFNGSLSSTDVNRNIFRAASLNSTGWFTGIDDNTLFSAIVTAATNPIICAGGGVVLNANTGIGYVYQWLFNGLPIPGANGPSHTATQAGDYQVQITNSGNVTATSTPLSIVVVAAPSANVAASGPLTYCPGGVLNLNANTGPGLLYQWALNGTNIPGATNATYPVNVAGNYTVTVSNKGCATTSALIPVNAGPLNVQLGTDTAFCQSKTTPLVLNAGYPGAKYTWNTNDTGQTINIFDRSGTYWVRVDAGPNCVDEDTIVVNVSPLPSVVGISYGHTGSTFQFSAAGAQNVKRYLWIFGNTYQDTAQVATFTYNGWTAMEVKLVVFNDCGSDTSYLQLPLNINSSSAKDVIFNLYPNPAVSEVTLSAEGGVSLGEITILNGLGQVVYRGDANNNSAHTINVNSLANGRYLIRANTSDGMVISKPFNVVR